MRSAPATMIVPEAFCCALDEFGIAEPRTVVVDEGEFVLWENIRVGLGFYLGVDLGQLPLEMLGETLVDTGGGVLCKMDGLSEGQASHAGYIFSTHGGQR